MGSKGAAPPVVCCMCGDYGLSRELFRCKLCQVRSQHKYCSDLYPKAESYRACNWCLREEGGKLSLARDSTAVQNSPLSSSSNSTSNNVTASNGSSGSGVKLQRNAFPSHLNKPIKKQRSQELPPTLGKARQVFRGKVRRYKLLEEVSS